MSEQPLKSRPAVAHEADRLVEQDGRDGQLNGVLGIGSRFDLMTAEGRFALGLWAGNQILAALHAPLKGRVVPHE